MTTYFTQFSELFELSNSSDRAWVQQYLDRVQRQIDKGYAFYDEPSLGFDWAIEDEGLWLYSDEAILDHVVMVVQRLLRRFNPDGHFVINFAETCSKPRAGAFTGGAIIVTQDQDEWIYPPTLVAERLYD